MRSLHAAAVAVMAVAVFSGACAPATGVGSGSYAPEELFPGRKAPPVVRVTNNNWSTMTVYAVQGTSRFRLGMVTSMSTAVLRIPASILASASGLRLLADPIGGSETFQTPAIHVSPGDEVQLDLQNHLPISSYSIFAQQ